MPLPFDIALIDDDWIDNPIVRSLIDSTDSASDEERTAWRGSVLGRSANLNRGFRMAAERFHADYFAESHTRERDGRLVPRPVYPEAKFVKRYRMSTTMFQQLCRDLANWDPYFNLKRDATGMPGIAPEIKIAAAIRQLASSEASDDEDQYFRLSESTASAALERFCQGIRAVYEKEWLRPPNEADLKLILAHSDSRGFPGMLGSLDCMHWGLGEVPDRTQRAVSGERRGSDHRFRGSRVSFSCSELL